MTKDQAAALIKSTLKAFGVTRPVTLNWTKRSRNGRAYMGSFRITIGPRAWRGVEMCLLHEIAHLLAPRNSHHNYKFFTILAKIVKHHFGDVRLYDWHNEYRRIRLWAWKEGWCIRDERGNYHPHPSRFQSAAGPKEDKNG